MNLKYKIRNVNGYQSLIDRKIFKFNLFIYGDNYHKKIDWIPFSTSFGISRGSLLPVCLMKRKKSEVKLFLLIVPSLKAYFSAF